MTGRRAKAGLITVALVVLLVEGFFTYRWYDRYQTPDTASGATSRTAPAGAPAPEGTTPEETAATGNTQSDAGDASFVHRSTGGNSRGDYTYLSDPSIEGDPDAVIVAVPSRDGVGSGDAYGHNVGVWFEPGKRKWAIFNQDLAAVPAGATFEVVVPPASERFVHRAVLLNTVGNATYLDDPLTNGKPDVTVSVTQNWNPGGGNGAYNDHPVGVLYDEDVGQWFVYNEDGASVPQGAAFNIAVSGGGEPQR